MNIISNFNRIIKDAFTWTLRIYSAIGVLCFFVSVQDFFDSNLPFWKKLLASILIFVIVFIIVLIVTLFIYGVLKKRIKVFSNEKKQSVYLCYGNIFKYKDKEKRNVVIPVNRCFDTIVNNELISEKSLHGQLFQNLYKTMYTTESLNIKIQQELEAQNFPSKMLDRIAKPQGNLKRYVPGTTIKLMENNTTYFLLGLSSLNANLKGCTTLEEYILAILRLVNYANTFSQGFPVILPLIGGGLSRTDLNDKEILKLLITILEMNKSKLISDFYIIVNNSISITDI